MEERHKQAFYALIERQTIQWELIDAGLASQEDEPAVPLRPKKEKEKVIYEKTYSSRI